MKLILLLVSLLFPSFAFVQPLERGYMQTSFNKDAQQLDETNAYLLGYLSYLAYPKYLYDYTKSRSPQVDIEEWHKMDCDNDYFLTQFRENTRGFFGNLPTQNYVFFSADKTNYDPEAILVTDSSCMWVIFRGTDSVMTEKKRFWKNYKEWLSTDFDVRKRHFEAMGKGKVCRGFAKSLFLIADNIAITLKKKGASHKKIWLCGHSLGAGQAILFAMYLYQNYGIKVQGIYGFACPPVGNQNFVMEVATVFSHNEFQRFEFVDDPVSFLPPDFLGFRQVGVRHHFPNINQVEYYQTERKPIKGNLHFLVFPIHIVGTMMKELLNLPKVKVPTGGLCFHHPEWYIQALYRPSVSQRLPNLRPMALPTPNSRACDCQQVTKAMGNFSIIAKPSAKQI